MLRYILGRAIGLVLVILGTVTVLFLVQEMIPGDPIRAFAGERVRAEQVEILRREFGLDKPLYVRYGTYLWNLARGDLGLSLTSQRRVQEDMRAYLPATLELAVVSIVIIAALGIPLGVLAAQHSGRALDQVTRLLAFVGAGLPVFWLGLMLMILFYGKLGWLPGGGRIAFGLPRLDGPTGSYLLDSLIAGNFQAFGSTVAHLVLPVVTLALGRLTVVTRLLRSTMLEILHEDYIRTARSKGVSERKIGFKHALRNAATPAITILGLQFGWILQGTILVEVVFSFPGIGYYAYNAMINHDLPVILAFTLVIAITFVVMNFLVDTLYAVVNPKLRTW